MNTTTMVKVSYGMTQEDLRRFGIEMVQDADGKPAYCITFLSKKVGDTENYAEFKELFKKIFAKPSTIFYHCEDVINEQASDDKIVKTIKIEERFMNGENDGV